MSDPARGVLRLKVVTPKRLLAETDADEVYIPTFEGQIGILPGHRPLYTGVGRGVLIYKSEGDEERLPIQGGFAEIRPDEVVVVTEMSGDDQEKPSAG
jgi:F-type H+-transporting ATPase subunit epsilon